MRKLNPALLGGGIIVGLLVAVSLFGPFLVPHSPYDLELARVLLPPSGQHWFGTDNFGRDVFSRVIFGARISLSIALAVQVVSISLGTVIGTLTGYYGRWLDEVVMRVTDVLLAFPSIIMAMAIAAALGANLQSVVVALSAKWWCGYARLMRGQVLSLKNRSFVEAARASGAKDLLIMVRHMLPNAFSPMLVKFTMDIGFTILSISSLSFIGLAAQPPTPEWGAMVRDGRTMIQSAWWISTLSGIAIIFSVIGFNLLGDGIAQHYDPMKKRRA